MRQHHTALRLCRARERWPRSGQVSRALADLTGAVWEALAHGAGIHYLTLASQVVAYVESAEAFWSIWEPREAGV